MEKSAQIRFFSATGKTEKIVRAFSEGLNYKTHFVNLAQIDSRQTILPVDCDIEILASPIYGERIPSFISAYMNQLKGNGTPLVVLSVIGNISPGISFTQYQQLAHINNFRLIGAGIFIAEHTYCTSINQVGIGRPNYDDLYQAGLLGKLVREKMELKNMSTIRLPESKLPVFIEKFPERGTRFIVRPPEADQQRCRHCGLCVIKCPVQAINPESLQIDESKCIRCMACKSCCPSSARKMEFCNMVIDRAFGLIGRRKKKSQIFV